MRDRWNILYLNLPEEIGQYVSDVLYDSIGEGFHVESYTIQGERIVDDRNCEVYHYIALYVENHDDMLESLFLIRKNNLHSRIILIVKDVESFILAQKYDVYYFLREDCLKEDCQGLYDLVKQMHQNQILYLHKDAKPIPIYNIMYIESNRNYLVYVTKKENLKDRATLKEIWQRYQGIQTFIYISKSVLVNPHYILTMKNDKILLHGGRELFVSRSKLEYVHSVLNRSAIVDAM